MISCGRMPVEPLEGVITMSKPVEAEPASTDWPGLLEHYRQTAVHVLVSHQCAWSCETRSPTDRRGIWGLGAAPPRTDTRRCLIT
jgi:hypothetical protein